MTFMLNHSLRELTPFQILSTVLMQTTLSLTHLFNFTALVATLKYMLNSILTNLFSLSTSNYGINYVISLNEFRSYLNPFNVGDDRIFQPYCDPASVEGSQISFKSAKRDIHIAQQVYNGYHLFRGSYLSFDHSPNPFYDVNDISTPLFNGGKLNQGSSTLLDDGVVLNQRDRIRYQLDSDLVGSFYLNSLSYQDLNYLLNIKGLETLSNVLHDQTLLVGSLRWSYRYNTLHRRSIYNSHKLTESKKLISAGFFDSSSMDNNL
jgi:hypothetical protein